MFRRATATFLFFYFAWIGTGSAIFGQHLHTSCCQVHASSGLTPLHHDHDHGGHRHRHHEPAPEQPLPDATPGHHDDHQPEDDHEHPDENAPQKPNGLTTQRHDGHALASLLAHLLDTALRPDAQLEADQQPQILALSIFPAIRIAIAPVTTSALEQTTHRNSLRTHGHRLPATLPRPPPAHC